MIQIDGQSRPHDACGPERSLWAAVMHVAVDDLRDSNTRIRYWALRWFRSDDPSFRSFLWVCGLLGLDPEAVRERVNLIKPGPRSHPRQATRCDMAELAEWFREREEKERIAA